MPLEKQEIQFGRNKIDTSTSAKAVTPRMNFSWRSLMADLALTGASM